MQCPGNEKHKGIRIEVCNPDARERDSSYAKAFCAECNVWICGLTRSVKRGLEAREDVRGARFEGYRYSKDDVVWYYSRAGDLRQDEILISHGDNTYTLNRDDAYRRDADLYPTKEEAEKDLSPAGRRMAGCFREASLIFAHAIQSGKMQSQGDARNDVIIPIAFQLFNTEDT